MHIAKALSPPLQFETIQGFFLQDDETTNHRAFDHTKQNLGLIEQSYPTDKPGDIVSVPGWQRFVRYIECLNHKATVGTTYKLLYMYRHGEGVHNVEEDFYGSKAWDEHWSKLDGNGTTTVWADALLTARGQQQAAETAVFLQKQWEQEGMPYPERYYVSPLYRCLQTAQTTFGSLKLPADRPFRPVVKELLRETLCFHTCNRRSSRTRLQSDFPHFGFEKGFTEEDLLWSEEHWETSEEIDGRTRKLLEDLFAHEEKMILSLTTSWGTMISLMRVLGHLSCRLPHCVIMPVFVKCTMTESEKKEERRELERQDSGVA